MTDDGPVMANLRLDGILPHDVTTRADYDLTEALTDRHRPAVFGAHRQRGGRHCGTVYLTFRNPAERELQVRAKFQHGHEVQMDPTEIDMTVAAKSEKVVAVAIQSSEAIPTTSRLSCSCTGTWALNWPTRKSLFMSGTTRYSAATESRRPDPDGRAGVC